ncbi:hypothetical protein ACS0TY_001584 [Phlomoides rotata]
MHRRRKRSYIPFLLNPETRSDVIPVRLHFRETIPQARQPISHRKVKLIPCENRYESPCVGESIISQIYKRLQEY